MQRELARRHVEACLDPPRGRVVTGHARARRVLPVEMADDVAAPAERPGLVREVEERLEFWQSRRLAVADRKSTRLNSSHGYISYAVFCLKKKINYHTYR